METHGEAKWRGGRGCYDVKSIHVKEHARVATRLRGRGRWGGGGAVGECSFDSNSRARQKTGITDARMERAVRELMDGKQHRLRGKDKLERLICRGWGGKEKKQLKI